MKNRDLKAMIRRAAEREMPEVRSKIDLGSVEILPETPKNRSHVFSLGKAFGYAALVLVVGFTTLFAYGALVATTTQPSALPLGTEEEIYGFQLVSAAALLEALGPVDQTSLALALPLDSEADSPLINDQLDDLLVYLDTLETMIGDKTTQSYVTETSDREGYAFLLVFDSADLLDNRVEYRIYYNQVPDPEDAEKSELSGLLVLGGVEYSLSGTVTDDGETVKTRFTASLDAENYVEVEDLSTPDTQKYEYRLYENGILTRSHFLRLELDGEDLQAVIECVDDDHEISFRFQKTLDAENREIIRVSYSFSSRADGEELEDGDIDVSVAYDEATQSYCYEYQVSYRQHGGHSGEHQGSGSRTDKTALEDETEDSNDQGNGSDNGNSSDNGNGSEDENGSDNGNGNDDGNNPGTSHGNGNSGKNPSLDPFTLSETGIFAI